MGSPSGIIPILHISDLHISEKNFGRVDNLLTKISMSIHRENREIQAVVLTGDIANSGLEVEYKLAKNLLQALADNLGIDSAHKIVIAPGNHDVNRSDVDELHEMGILTLLKQEDGIENLLSSESKRSNAFKRMANYEKFSEKSGFTHKTKIIEINGINIGFAVLNTAWRASSDFDQGKLFIGKSFVNEAVKITDSADFSIALMHHPIHWLAELEQDYMHAFLSQHFPLICIGHRHSNSSYKIDFISGSTFFSAAKAGGTGDATCGYTILNIDVTNNKIETLYRSYNKNLDEFVLDFDWSIDAKHVHDFPEKNRASLRIFECRTSLIKAGRQRKSDFLRLISNLAPDLHLNLENMLINIALKTTESSKPKKCRYSDLIASTNSWVIFAPPLAGKSAILTQIITELQIQGISCIMVHFSEIKCNDEKQWILDHFESELGISRSKARDLVKLPYIILIDDVDFYQKPVIQFLSKWINATPQARIIATSGQEPGILRSEGFNIETTFSPLTIQTAELLPISIKEIQRIVSNAEDIGLISTGGKSVVAQYVANSFRSGLPRQPWTVLMYLNVLAQGYTSFEAQSLLDLIRKYCSLRTAQGVVQEPQVSAEVIDRAFSFLANLCYQSPKFIANKKELIDGLNADYARSGLPLAGIIVVDALLSTGLAICDNSHAIKFAFHVFLEYYMAIYWIQSVSPNINELDGPTLNKFGGALTYLAGLHPESTEILQKSLEITESYRLNSSKTISIEQLKNACNIEINPAEDIDKNIKITSDDMERMDDSLSKMDKKKTAKNLEKISKLGPEELRIELFQSSFKASLTVLRSNIFIDIGSKIAACNEAIELASSFICYMISRIDELDLRELFDIKTESEEKKVDGLLVSLLTILGNSFLSVNASTDHLITALEQLYETESDPFKKMVIIMWISYIDRQKMTLLLLKYVADVQNLPLLSLLQMWFLFIYIEAAILDGTRDQEIKMALITTERAIVESRMPSKLPQHISKSKVNNIVSSYEKKVEQEIDFKNNVEQN
jgi:predicted MPP superfamily phosphohydrolase